MPEISNSEIREAGINRAVVKVSLPGYSGPAKLARAGTGLQRYSGRLDLVAVLGFAERCLVLTLAFAASLALTAPVLLTRLSASTLEFRWSRTCSWADGFPGTAGVAPMPLEAGTAGVAAFASPFALPILAWPKSVPGEAMAGVLSCADAPPWGARAWSASAA